jgi:hypothetical protein
MRGVLSGATVSVAIGEMLSFNRREENARGQNVVAYESRRILICIVSVCVCVYDVYQLTSLSLSYISAWARECYRPSLHLTRF